VTVYRDRVDRDRGPEVGKRFTTHVTVWPSHMTVLSYAQQWYPQILYSCSLLLSIQFLLLHFTSLHKISNKNAVKVANFVASKNLIAKNIMFPHRNIHKLTCTCKIWSFHSGDYKECRLLPSLLRARLALLSDLFRPYTSPLYWFSMWSTLPPSLFLYSWAFLTGGSVCSHLLTLVPRSRIFLPWRWRRFVPPKRRFT
jgi:hypothetical protein